MLAAVGKFDGGDFLFVRVEILLLALLRGRTCRGLDVVGRGVDVSAAIGKNVLYRQDLGAQVAQLFVDLFPAGSRALVGLFEGLFQRLIFCIAFDVFLGNG